MTADERTTGGKVSQDAAMPEVEIPDSVRRHRISGVFSSQAVVRVGTGTTSRKVIQKAYWFAEEAEPDEDGRVMVMVRPLNKNNVPSGQAEAVAKADFLERYNPELEYYQKEVYPRMKELDTTLKRAEAQREQGALYSAQFEYEAALNVDEENVRANFGLGLTYMERGDASKAGDIFKRVVSLEAAFAPEHKHLFNEFGINLRKSKLLDQAVEYYERALQLTDSDENLHYNIARAYFERGDRDQCLAHLHRALELNPRFEEARKFLAYVEKEGGGRVLDM
ncbi:tetratricopeptide repeat protein [Pseudodesulfovibrio pelocollis]|uniref:tetratricopeptide repeat protein n=1 Tax=Pseudodesulfovibrio pelocollis TaxID=3051432 RepID=UPI00255B0D88|nr:tetratricopeptide repeat protein [Pseudodesulfovibrio sp. SB368]